MVFRAWGLGRIPMFSFPLDREGVLTKKGPGLNAWVYYKPPTILLKESSFYYTLSYSLKTFDVFIPYSGHIKSI